MTETTKQDNKPKQEKSNIGTTDYNIPDFGRVLETGKMSNGLM